MFVLKTLLPDERMELKTFDDGRIILITLDNSRIVLNTTIQPDLLAPIPVTSPVIAPSIPYPGIIATVSTGLWGGTQPIVYTYQWVRDDGISQTAIPGATGNAYVVQNADIGSELYVEVTATNVAGSVTVDSNTTNAVIDAQAPVNIVAPVISGTLAVGNTLSLVSDGTWTGNPAPTFSYQWLINGSYLAGEIGPTLLIEAGMETGNIELMVFGSNIIATVPALSNEINNFIPPSIVTPPSVSGSTVEGNLLTATTGTWNGALPISYTYQWYRYNGVVNNGIAGATNSTYTTTNTDVGRQIRVEVLATNAYGFASSISTPVGPITSAATIPANTIAPVASGTVRIGQTLSSTSGTWTGTPTPTISYQWRRNGVAIVGATSSAYVVVGADVPAIIDCLVTATNVAGAVSADTNNLSSPWQPILALKPTAKIIDCIDPACMGGASVGSPIPSFSSVDGTLIASQSVSSKRAQRDATGAYFDGTDDEYIGESALLSYFNGDHVIAGTLSTLSGLTNRVLIHAYNAANDNYYIRINASYSLSTARNYYRRQSIGGLYTLIQYPLATDWKFTVVTQVGTPGTSNIYDLTSGVTLHQTQSANLATASLEGWKFGGHRDSNAWMQGRVNCFVMDNNVWDSTTIGVFRACAVNAGVM